MADTVSGSLKHSQVWWFAREDSQDTAYSYTHSTSLSQQRIQSKISKTKTHMWQSREETRHKFPRVLSCEVTQDVLHSSSNELWQPGWNVYQGSAVEIGCPRLLLGIGQVDAICLAHTKISDFQKELRCSA